MKAAYEMNPSMGDPQSVQGQMHENGQKLDKLHRELQKFQGYLEEVDGGKGPSTPFSQKRKSSTNSTSSSSHPTQQQESQTHLSASGGKHVQRNSISEDSLSRSASDSSFSSSSPQPHPVQNNNPSSLSSVIHQNNVSASSIVKNQQNNSYNQQNGVSKGCNASSSDSQKLSPTLKANG